MRLSFKYRVYPTASQVVFLTGELREAASLYNAALEERIGAWNTCRKSAADNRAGEADVVGFVAGGEFPSAAM